MMKLNDELSNVTNTLNIRTHEVYIYLYIYNAALYTNIPTCTCMSLIIIIISAHVTFNQSDALKVVL